MKFFYVGSEANIAIYNIWCLRFEKFRENLDGQRKDNKLATLHIARNAPINWKKRMKVLDIKQIYHCALLSLCSAVIPCLNKFLGFASVMQEYNI